LPLLKLAGNIVGGSSGIIGGAGGGNRICGASDVAVRVAGIKGVRAEVVGNHIHGGGGGFAFMKEVGALVADNKVSGMLGSGIGVRNQANAELARNIFEDVQGRPIELVREGGAVEPDPDDSDNGPNDLQNYPFLGVARAEPGGGFLARVGLLAKPKGRYRVELFGASSCDPFGQIAAELYLGAQELNTKASGAVSEFISMPSSTGGLPFIAATVTDLEAKQKVTSEFSGCVPVAEADEPAVGITPSSLEVKKGKMSAEVECLDTAQCEGTATLEDRDTGEDYATFSIGLFSGSQKIKLKLTPEAKEILAEQKRLAAELTASMSTTAGTALRQVNVMLRDGR
jgi:hypothetical protein